MPDTEANSACTEGPQDETTFTLDELCRTYAVEGDWIVELVEWGVVEPCGTSQAEWLFESVMIARVAKAQRLARDLDLNPPGIALAFDLLQQIEKLQARLQHDADVD